MALCGSCLRWGLAILVALIAVAAMFKDEPVVQVTLMRFFRDVARAKAHARLYGNRAALAVFTEVDVDHNSMSEPPNVVFTPEDLSQFDGSEGRPIYLAVAGRVYDVSSKRDTYGEGGSYHKLAGKDASRALAMACMSERCFSSSLEGITQKQQRELNKWIDFFDKHDKYHCIGRLQASDAVEGAVQAALNQEKFAAKITRISRDKYQARLEQGQSSSLAAMTVAEGTLRDGFQLHQRERVDDAVSAFESGLRVLEEVKDVTDGKDAIALIKGKLLMACATAKMHLQHFEATLKYLQQAVDTLHGLEGDQACRLSASAYADLGTILASIEDPDSHAVLQVAHSIYKQCPNVLEVPHVMGWIRTASTLARMGELTQDDYNVVEQVVEKFGEPQLERMLLPLRSAMLKQP
eukprot:TRINITY_DN12406_c0_g2_i1.p2 TRINITY_DN12406_c0_g2~~TRINITY_DN12406_c0_g2_i1.p2  ORF type:complete len:408 (+),score=76.76 TRINITY_DN12406_c0_g2_i1:159-1382(+)